MIVMLKSGKSFQIDDVDMAVLDGVCATITTHGYVSLVKYEGRDTSGKYKYSRKYLHRAILNASSDKQVDHIDGNKLNNSKSNLRLCTNSENSRNTRPKRGKYKGVYFDKKRGQWVAQITVDRKCTSLGSYLSPEDAALAYNEAAKSLHGEFAYINKVEALV